VLSQVGVTPVRFIFLPQVGQSGGMGGEFLGDIAVAGMARLLEFSEIFLLRVAAQVVRQ